MPAKPLFLLCVLLLVSGPAAAQSSPLQIVVSVLPQQYLVERIAGDRVEVLTLVQPGDNEATYSPGPATLAALDAARLWFTLGVHFEQVWLERITRDRPALEVVSLAAGLPLRAVEASWTAGRPEHGETHDHDHAGLPDPHTWTDPRLAARMAVRIAETLARLDPDGADLFHARVEALRSELLELHEEIAARLAPVQGEAFIVFHPSWGYFADAYGLRQLPIEIGGREPGPRGLAELITRGREADARVVFVQQQFSQRSARAVAEAIGAEVVEADPLALDYIDNLRAVSRRMLEALSPEGAAP
ncbi:metal ABC transporter solute-binding protein, Zn/Mn family [Thioalkalivibrio sp. XN279]|uniref:metal ABC transporter solute-binding protein, Zn/Mn family n=1 Tax=Thioalkalivibrio sp. XN279 TaxID=2714953 RepID=UPI00140D1183|nr:zinc ABC transporter substrate-binding protein [Thioalkalivibrio sp. XN279]NHA13472.1 zinc ABC transporter solute-binding protein [Thioalkalivibrio sp. XN279]